MGFALTNERRFISLLITIDREPWKCFERLYNLRIVDAV